MISGGNKDAEYCIANMLVSRAYVWESLVIEIPSENSQLSPRDETLYRIHRKQTCAKQQVTRRMLNHTIPEKVPWVLVLIL